ncbi:MAG: hypothetical protein D6715_05605 [Calditrichaeota bacterium]|nr:MAG: hypothetical protein D6715_05605 [Calditrichota bacterium]
MNTELVEVAFKAGRIGIYSNPVGFTLKPGEYVIVEADKGEDIGKVVNLGKIFLRPEQAEEEKLANVMRKASDEELEQLEKNRRLEEEAIKICKKKIFRHGLNMNLVDAEYQLDHKKLTFYFTAPHRVDFRKLVRDLAGHFKTRIELRQIGVRDAARHVDGYDVCGCRLCCTLFLKKFENISIQYVKDQLLPMNTSRLTGVCGRLKCCLAYERDFYLEELARYPRIHARVKTPKGTGKVDKIDIFNAQLYVRLENDEIERFNREEILPAEAV